MTVILDVLIGCSTAGLQIKVFNPTPPALREAEYRRERLAPLPRPTPRLVRTQRVAHGGEGLGGGAAADERRRHAVRLAHPVRLLARLGAILDALACAAARRGLQLVGGAARAVRAVRGARVLLLAVRGAPPVEVLRLLRAGGNKAAGHSSTV